MPLRWRLRDGLATGVLWVAYLGLVRAAIEGVIDLLHGRITSLEGARVLAVAPTLIDYATFIAMNGTILIGWALYNWVRFHGPDRRRSITPVTPEAVALHFGADIDLPRTMAATRVGILRHDADGRILGFEPVSLEPEARGSPLEAVPAK
ncbi:MAG: poly-beta-1,6-N-acetyl-D-glucosamine biosynthesis protein PgaD [Alphaproteobacteria bacterium]|nr:poly-beta-1,6-N-acetyl-D-glucosamine biosynthesis protein PgaD [Alphaproteobacteria bacterium]